jgi:hypothetical protein
MTITTAYLAERTDALLTRVDQLLLGQVLVATQAYDSATTDADPGPGEFRFNNATFASITKIWIDNVDSNAADISAWVDRWDDGTGTIKGTLVYRGVSTASAFRIFEVTGSVVDKTGYRELTVTPIVTGGTWTAGESFAPVFIRAGDAGGTGASYAATSTTSLSLGSSGPRAFTTQAGLAYVVGSRLRAASAADPTGKFMEGVVTAYSSTTLTITADYAVGSGTVNDWRLSITGEGAPGAAAAATSATAAATSATNAATSATNAATSATAAATSATSASGSASGRSSREAMEDQGTMKVRPDITILTPVWFASMSVTRVSPDIDICGVVCPLIPTDCLTVPAR